MSEPTPDTVREWLASIDSRLAGAGGNAELLAEIRYLNQGLFGSTAQNPAEFPPNNLLSFLFTTSYTNWNNGQVVQNAPIAQLLRGDGNGNFGYSAGASLADMLDQLFFLIGRIGQANNQSIASTLFDSFGRLDAIAAALGGLPGGTTNVTYLSNILAALGELGQNGGPLTAREYLAGILVQTTRQADCCEGGSTGGGTAPAWSSVACPNHPELTATFTFSGEITSNGALPSGLALASSPPNWSTNAGDTLTGPLVTYSLEQISACYVVAVDPAYTGTVGAQLVPYGLDPVGGAPGRPSPAGANPGPTSYTHFGWSSSNSEAFIGYGCSIAIGPSDPPLQGSQVRVYIGRPDPTP